MNAKIPLVASPKANDHGSGLGDLIREGPRNVDPAHERDVTEPLGVIYKSRQGIRAGRIARDPRMQSDRHHPAEIVTIVAKPVEGGFCRFQEMLRAAIACPQDIARIVDHERIRHDQMSSAMHFGPVRQIIIVGVGIVEEATLLDDELPGVDAHFSAVPAEWSCTRGLLDGNDGALDRLALFVPGHFIVVAPAITVAGHFIAAALDLLGHCRVAFERHGRTEERNRYAGCIEDPEHAPDPRARAILVHGLDREVSLVVHGKRQLIHAVIDLVAHGEGLLRSFLVIDHDLHGHLGAILPAQPGWMFAIPDQLTWQARDIVDIRLTEELRIEFHLMTPLSDTLERQSRPARLRAPSTTSSWPFT